MFPPERIVCLTEETVETLYLLGEEHRIVGISGYTSCGRRGPGVKSRASPPLHLPISRKSWRWSLTSYLTFSDLQAEIATTLIRAGVSVHAFNQRSIEEILDMIRMLGAIVGAADRADRLASELEQGIAAARRRAARLPWRPKVYFEEWDEPMISGIGWVSELIETAGGVDIFADRATCKSAKERIVSAAEVIERQPDIIIGSWCGKKFRPEKLASRPGFDGLSAVRSGALHEIKSSLILQPGPAALTDGLAALEAIIGRVSTKALAVSA